MAVVRTNLSDSIVTARKFVQIGSDAEVTKNRLRALSSALSSEAISSQVESVKNISLDSKITPEEKIGLAKEWERMKLAYASTKASAEDLQIDNSSEFIAMSNAYATLTDLMAAILGDMSISTGVDINFTIAFDSYIAASSAFTSYMIAVKEGIENKFSAYRCFIDISPADITYEDTVTLSARIMNGTTKVTNQVVDDIGADKAFNWEFSGTRDDEYYNEYAKGKQAIEVPASDIFASSRFNVRFYAELKVSSL